MRLQAGRQPPPEGQHALGDDVVHGVRLDPASYIALERLIDLCGEVFEAVAPRVGDGTVSLHGPLTSAHAQGFRLFGPDVLGVRVVINPPFVAYDGPGPVMAAAIHAGHSLRPEIAARIALDEEVRRREEDPHTDLLTDIVPLRVTVDRSRFEVDLNRPRDQAVHVVPDQAWGLQVWRTELDSDTIEKSLAIYDSFYDEIGRRLDVLATRGPFVVLDIHSYNHRRDGAGLPAGLRGANPDVNIGTGSLDRPVWAGLIDRLAIDLGTGLAPEATVAENVRFKGGYFSQWIHERYPDRGCALALEFKKTFMDEWTGEVDLTHLGRLRDALARTIPGVLTELEALA